jgi:nucleotide-binding universal stress UspA family protein
MNYTIKRILAAVDFSEPSLNALDTAVCLAEKNNATLYIIHVQDNIFEFTGINGLTLNSTVNHSANILTALANDIGRRINTKPIILEEEGFATQVILKSIMSNKCDLVVMGTYGASGYRDGFIGTNTYSVVKYAPCPVLIIPPGKKWSSFKRTLFPVRPVITALRHYEVLKNFLFPGSFLEILGLSSGQRETKRDMERAVTDLQTRMAADDITASTCWEQGNSIPDNVLSQADKNNADLLIVTPAIDVSTKQYYIGPNAHRIIHQAKIPLLSINRVNVQIADARLS